MSKLRIVSLPFLCGALMALTACSGDDSTTAGSTSGGGGSGGAPFEPAAHTALPQLRDHGQGVFDKLELITITFDGYVHKDLVESFGDWVGTSDYYLGMGKEYGVGAATHLAKVVLTDPVPANDFQLIKLINSHIEDGSIPSPDDHPQALYAVYFPPDAKFDEESDPLCAASLAYHYQFQTSTGKMAPYAVIGDCGSDPNYGAISNVSHEIIEVATDPFNAWYVDPGKTDPWHFVSDDEVADMCEYFQVVTEDTFPLSRWWSNKAAAANENPCQPVPPNDPIYRMVSASPTTVVTVASGASTKFTLTGWSTAETKPWKLTAEAEPSYSTPGLQFGLKASLDKKTIGNGDTATLTVTLPANVPSGQIGIVGVYTDNYAEAWYVGVKSE